MSTCISRQGEYGEHLIAEDGKARDRFVCQRCFVWDEEAALDEIDRLTDLIGQARTAVVERLAQAEHMHNDAERRVDGLAKRLADVEQERDLHFRRAANLKADLTRALNAEVRRGNALAAHTPPSEPATEGVVSERAAVAALIATGRHTAETAEETLRMTAERFPAPVADRDAGLSEDERNALVAAVRRADLTHVLGMVETFAAVERILAARVDEAIGAALIVSAARAQPEGTERVEWEPVDG